MLTNLQQIYAVTRLTFGSVLTTPLVESMTLERMLTSVENQIEAARHLQIQLKGFRTNEDVQAELSNIFGYLETVSEEIKVRLGRGPSKTGQCYH